METELNGKAFRLSFKDAAKDVLAEMTYTYLQDNNPAILEGSRTSWRTWMTDLHDVNQLGWQWTREFFRQVINEDYWITDRVFKSIYEYYNQRKYTIIIPDVHYANEVEWCKTNNFFVVRVTGPCRLSEDSYDQEHPSEDAIDNLKVNEEFDNFGPLEKLQEYAKKLVDSLVLESWTRAEVLALSLEAAKRDL